MRTFIQLLATACTVAIKSKHRLECQIIINQVLCSDLMDFFGLLYGSETSKGTSNEPPSIVQGIGGSFQEI